MDHWKLSEIETPLGQRSPVVLHSEEGESRVVLIVLEPGQELGEHPLKETAFRLVADASIRVEAGGETVDASLGELFRFDPDERHTVSSPGGARLLLYLAPWPGIGHYRGEERSVSAS